VSEGKIKILVEAVDRATGALKNVAQKLDNLTKATEKTTEKFSMLHKVGAVAAGMLVRDMVRGLSSTFSEVTELGGKVETLNASFEALSRAQGKNVDTLEELRKATRGTVADVDLLTAANQALMFGLPTDNLGELFNAAIKLGHAMGIDAKKAVESLTTGIGRQSKLILDNLGIVFKAEDAYKWYAEQLGKTTNQLSEAEKREGWMRYAILQVTEAAKKLGDTESETMVKQEQWNASITNLKTSIGRLLSPLGAITPILNQMITPMSTIAAAVIPQMIAQYGFLGAATTAWGTITAATSKLVTASIYSIPIIGWIAAVISAVILLYEAWVNNWGGIREKVGAVIDALKAAWDAFVSGLKWAWDNILVPLGKFFATVFYVHLLIVKKALEAISNALKPVIDGFKFIGDALGGFVSSLFGSPQTVFEDAAEGIKKMKKEMRKLPGFPAIPTHGLPVPASPVGNITITGPLVNVEGSVDKATAEYAAELVKEKLQSVIVENTSSNAVTKRIRMREW